MRYPKPQFPAQTHPLRKQYFLQNRERSRARHHKWDYSVELSPQLRKKWIENNSLRMTRKVYVQMNYNAIEGSNKTNQLKRNQFYFFYLQVNLFYFCGKMCLNFYCQPKLWNTTSTRLYIHQRTSWIYHIMCRQVKLFLFLFNSSSTVPVHMKMKKRKNINNITHTQFPSSQ